MSVPSRRPIRPPSAFRRGQSAAPCARSTAQAGKFLDSLRMNHELVKGSSELGVPDAGKGSWSTLLSDFAAFENYETGAISGAMASDLVAWKTQSSAAEKARDAIISDLIVAGLAGRDPCQDLFFLGAYHG